MALYHRGNEINNLRKGGNEITTAYYRGNEIYTTAALPSGNVLASFTDTPHIFIRENTGLFAPTPTPTPTINDYVMHFRIGGRTLQRGIIAQASDRINFSNTAGWSGTTSDAIAGGDRDPTESLAGQEPAADATNAQPSFALNRLASGVSGTFAFRHFSIWPIAGIEAGDNNYHYVGNENVTLRERISVMDVGINPDSDSELLTALQADSNAFLVIWNSENERVVRIPFSAGWSIQSSGTQYERMRYRPPADTTIGEQLWDVFCPFNHRPTTSLRYDVLNSFEVEYEGSQHPYRKNMVISNYAPSATNADTDAHDVALLNAAGYPNPTWYQIYLFVNSPGEND